VRKTYDLLAEPTGETWASLLHALSRYAVSLQMVVREDLPLSKKGRDLLAALQPHLLQERKGAAWPGTMLLCGEAAIVRFELNASVIAAVLEVAEGLYAWQQPDLPEDLALLAEDGTAILTSIAHERDGYLTSSDAEHESLVRAVPVLRDMLGAGHSVNQSDAERR
jgi:hypothetical protein